MKRISLFLLFLFIILFSISNIAFGVTYTFKSVWNERVGYDPNYFLLGTSNNITAGAIISDIGSLDPASLNHSVSWGSNTHQLDYLPDFPGRPDSYSYVRVLGANVTDFTSWEGISYEFFIDSVSQGSVSVASGDFQELVLPVYNYESSTYSMTWQEVTASQGTLDYVVRILGSTGVDDVLWQSESLEDEMYMFTDPVAISLLDAGSILSVEARNFKSRSEFFNTSIYVSETAPVPEPATFFLFGAGLVGLAGLGRKKLFKK